MISQIITGVFTAAYLLCTLWLCRGLRLDARALCTGAVFTAATLVLAAIMIPLPTGAMITLGSMLPLMVLALIYDYRLAMVSGWLAGILAMLLLPAWQPVHWAQIFVEQLVCFSCLGYAGIFGRDRRWKIALGGALALALKFTGHVLSGVVFFSDNAWSGWGAWAYSLTYHLTSKIPEGILTIIILMLLPLNTMAAAVKGGKRNAVSR